MCLKCFFTILVLCVLSILCYSCKLGKKLSTADCYPERKTIETLINQSGTIIKVSETYVILSQDGNSRYLACNLPKTYNKEGIKVKYALKVKEIFPNERLIATPAYLTEINQ
jgi:hypothetical protein